MDDQADHSITWEVAIMAERCQSLACDQPTSPNCMLEMRLSQLVRDLSNVISFPNGPVRKAVRDEG